MEVNHPGNTRGSLTLEAEIEASSHSGVQAVTAFDSASSQGGIPRIALRYGHLLVDAKVMDAYSSGNGGFYKPMN